MHSSSGIRTHGPNVRGMFRNVSYIYAKILYSVEQQFPLKLLLSFLFLSFLILSSFLFSLFLHFHQYFSLYLYSSFIFSIFLSLTRLFLTLIAASPTEKLPQQFQEHLVYVHIAYLGSCTETCRFVNFKHI
jgi:hypothetical protein